MQVGPAPSAAPPTASPDEPEGPEPTPIPKPPTGPGTWMPPPPTLPMLEQYRESLEVLRTGVESDLQAGKIPLAEYSDLIDEYRRRMQIYKESTKLVVGTEIDR